MNVTHVPILIVGAGAGGLSASALLAKYGVRSLLVEKRREILIYRRPAISAFAAWRFSAVWAWTTRFVLSPIVCQTWSSSRR